MDTEPFEITDQTESSAGFTKNFSLPNAAGTILDVRVDRFIKLLTIMNQRNVLNVSIDPSLSVVGYESANTLTNTGKDKWTEESGALSIWMLAMFNPSEKGVVFIPFKKGTKAKRENSNR
jgi:hypothetical protein